MHRIKGTPQGSVIRPLIANLYLHQAFGIWMEKYFPTNPFERYADDIIVHCNSKEEAEQLVASIQERLAGSELEFIRRNEAGVLQKLLAKRTT